MCERVRYLIRYGDMLNGFGFASKLTDNGIPIFLLKLKIRFNELTEKWFDAILNYLNL